MQKITIIGHLGRDVEDRRTASGKRVISFSIAVKASKDTTQWFDVSVWENRIPMFEGMLKHIKKGSQLLIIGDLSSPEVYQSKDGTTKVKLKIQPLSMNFVGSSKDKAEEQRPQQTIAEQESSFDDGVPF